jgi:outer membrane protein OmpA-like peptidoglycan-associated protein
MMKLQSRLLVLSAASALFLAGCEGAGERQQSGAIMGGMVGGLLGATGDDEDGARNAALGTAAGAMAGGMIGAMLDEQAEDLRSSLENDGIIVENTGEFLRVTMPGGLLFDSDSAAVEPLVQADLRAVARNLLEYPDSTVAVIGHTDDTGSPEYNQGLSERRAQAVRAVLVQQGVAPVRVRAIGRGETLPVASNSTPEGRQQNRRVEIIIRPNA